MNIESSNLKKTTELQAQNSKSTNKNNNEDSSVKFADELKEAAKNEAKNEKIQQEENIKQENSNKTAKKTEENKEITVKKYEDIPKNNTNEQTLNNGIPNLNSAMEDMNYVLKEFNQSEDKTLEFIKKEEDLTDKNNMINNDFNIQENKEILPQMTPNMNFSGDGQPFSSFMNNENEEKKSNNILGNSAQDLAEEAAILSTMAENIAIANKNQILNEKSTSHKLEKIPVETKITENTPIQNIFEKPTRIVMDEEGIKEIDTKTGIKTETIVKYDTVIMNQADVEVFTTLVEKGEVNLNELAPKVAEKAVNISKTLADMLAKSMENNQPLRINFDNDISVIIRISRDGKITADFLPSSQIAEAYLKENLPLLKQRFEDNNIEYDSLNQRERKEQQKENNKKKDRNNE